MIRASKVQKKVTAASGKVMAAKVQNLANRKYGNDDRFKSKFCEIALRL